VKIRDSFGGQLQRTSIFSRDTIDGRMPLRRRHADRSRGEFHTIEFGGQIDQRAIAALSHVGDYLRHRSIDAGAVAAAPCDYRGQKFSELRRLRLENPRPHYSCARSIRAPSCESFASSAS
jgi:hypothetical protein